MTNFIWQSNDSGFERKENRQAIELAPVVCNAKERAQQYIYSAARPENIFNRPALGLVHLSI